jgi:MerR family transcriptional regulator, heat shock protein HspR
VDRRSRIDRTQDAAARGSDHAERRAVYIISVAAELAGVHPQTLRIYEQKGLVTPSRTRGNSRRYSEEDIDRLRRVQALTQRGVNLAGAKRIIELEDEVERLEELASRLRVELDERAIPMPGSRISVQIVPVDTVAPPPWDGRE